MYATQDIVKATTGIKDVALEVQRVGRGVCGVYVDWLFVGNCADIDFCVAMRRNADLFVMLTTMNLTTLDHVYKEFASVEWRSFVDFCACMLRHTENYGSFIIDNNDPNARGLKRFFTYTAQEKVKQFTMLCRGAWETYTENSRTEMANRQRHEHKQTNKYSLNYLKQLKNADATKITHEQYFNQSAEAARAKDANHFSVLLKGAR